MCERYRYYPLKEKLIRFFRIKWSIIRILAKSKGQGARSREHGEEGTEKTGKIYIFSK